MVNTFISYGGPDEVFAKELRDALVAAGIQTFFFPETAQYGRRLHHIMRDGVQASDRVLLICSARSLSRPGVLNEIEETLSREASEGGRALLIPISLDNYLFNGWSPAEAGLASALKQRVVANFQSVQPGMLQGSKEFKRLVDAITSDYPTIPLTYYSYIELLDVQGHRANWLIKKSLIVNTGSLNSFTFNDIDATGRILTASSKNGPVSLISKGGGKTAKIDFGKPFNAGDVVEMELKIELEDCHLNSQEDLRSRMVSGFRTASWWVSLPQSRQATAINCYLLEGTKRTVYPIEYRTTPKECFGMTVINPPLGGYFCVDWTW